MDEGFKCPAMCYRHWVEFPYSLIFLCPGCEMWIDADGKKWRRVRLPDPGEISPASVSKNLPVHPVDPDFVKDVQQDPTPDAEKTWAEYLAEAGVPLPAYERTETEKKEGMI